MKIKLLDKRRVNGIILLWVERKVFLGKRKEIYSGHPITTYGGIVGKKLLWRKEPQKYKVNFEMEYVLNQLIQ